MLIVETSESSSDEEKAAYKAKLQSLSWGRVPGANRTEKGTRAKPNPAWERGFKTETRVDGSQMPYVDGNGDIIRMKKWSENERAYTEQIRQMRQPTPE